GGPPLRPKGAPAGCPPRRKAPPPPCQPPPPCRACAETAAVIIAAATRLASSTVFFLLAMIQPPWVSSVILGGQRGVCHGGDGSSFKKSRRTPFNSETIQLGNTDAVRRFPEPGWETTRCKRKRHSVRRRRSRGTIPSCLKTS